MSQDRNSNACEPSASRARSRGLQTGVRTLLVLTACCGVFFWAARHVWESQHPLLVMARGLQSWSPSDRVFAIRELERFGIGESETAIPPLVAALKDSQAEVRVAAA